jgi:polyadenylate-binding protein
LKYDKKKNNNLYVKNFPLSYTEEDLLELFKKFGEILSVFIQKKESGESKGFGFVCFKNGDDASRAIANLHIEDGKGLYVQEFKSK